MSLRSVAVLGLSLVLVAVSVGAVQNAPEKNDPGIRDLMMQREQILQKLVEMAKSQYEQGIMSFDDVIAAERELLDAQLDAAATPAERIAIRESQLKLAERQEKMVARLVSQAAESPKDLMTAKANRLTAHIELLREKRSK